MTRWLAHLGLVVGGFLAAFALLAAVELTLRAAGVGAQRPRRDPFAGFSRVVPLFEPATRAGGVRVFRMSEARQRAATGQAAVDPQHEFLSEKPPGSFRIFAVGDSSAAGVPYGTRYAFPAWLAQALAAELPGVSVEIVNAAVSGYATRRIATVVDELAAHQPDLLIVYAGHNEVAERRFYAHLVDLDPRWFRLWETLVSTRLYGVIASLRGELPDEAPRVDLDDAAQDFQMFAQAQARADGSSPYATAREIAWGANLYRFNLEQIVRRMHAAGARTLLIGQGQNFSDWPPGASEHGRALTPGELARWNADYEAGQRHEQAGDCASAQESFARAAHIDAEHAELAYHQARCDRALGGYDAARAGFRRASDLDRIPHGAPTRYNAIVREVALAEGALFLDADALLERASEHGLVGDALFADPLHPNLRAHVAIAAGIAETLRAAGVPLPSERWRAARWSAPDADALYRAEPSLAQQERLIHGFTCLLARRDDCALADARAVLAADPGHALARQLRDQLEQASAPRR